MRKIKYIAVFFLPVLISLSFAGDSVQDGFISHPVKKGESVSFLCIEYYGYYSKELGVAVQKDNPGLSDINVIVVGQTLRFRAPRKAQAARAAPKVAVSPIDTLFVKKVAAQQGVITCVQGSVLLYRQGMKKGEPVTVNATVIPGDRLQTADNGRVEIIINRETVIRLKEKSALVIEAFRNSGADKGKTAVGFSLGTIWTKMKQFKDKISRFELELPNAVAGVHGTVYETEVNDDNSSEVKVYSGEVAVQGKGSKQAKHGGTNGVHEVSGPQEVQGPTEVDLDTWVRIVRAMQKVSIDKNGKASEPTTFPADSASDWEQWNNERDRRVNEMFMEN
jgi:hypothetical protein